MKIIRNYPLYKRAGHLTATLHIRVMASSDDLCDSLRYFCEVPVPMLKRFKDLSEKEIVAVAIANEEEDGRSYGEFADALRDSYPAPAAMFDDMRAANAAPPDPLRTPFPHP